MERLKSSSLIRLHTPSVFTTVLEPHLLLDIAEISKIWWQLLLNIDYAKLNHSVVTSGPLWVLQHTLHKATSYLEDQDGTKWSRLYVKWWLFGNSIYHQNCVVHCSLILKSFVLYYTHPNSLKDVGLSNYLSLWYNAIAAISKDFDWFL